MDTQWVRLPELTMAELGDGWLHAPGTHEHESDRAGVRTSRWASSARHAALVLFPAFVLLLLARAEMRTSWLQSRALSRLAATSAWTMADSSAPHTDGLQAPVGPYDIRLGYTDIRPFSERLERSGFQVESRAVPSAGMTRLVDWGLFPIYREKTEAGLQLTGSEGEPMFRASDPAAPFPSFDAVPPLVRDVLLWIENRELMGAASPTTNPAIEWRRLSGAVAGYTLRPLWRRPAGGGGSTLATQIEKFRHAPHGVTTGPLEKLRQIASASLRAYLEGPQTAEARRRIVTDYVNSVPLAAIPGHGEVHGLGTGLWAWYGMNPEEVGRVLATTADPADSASLAKRAAAFRAVVSLFVAQRRPTYYLTQAAGRSELGDLVDVYVRLLALDEVISPELRDATLRAATLVHLRARAPLPSRDPLVQAKAVQSIRSELLGLLGVDRLYRLDRLDLTVQSTISVETQRAVSEELGRLHDSSYVRSAGLSGYRLLEGADPTRVVYGMLLVERTPMGNMVRVQSDNFPGPFDINRSSKLELGSTAKLRTLVGYLEIIASVYQELTVSEPIVRDSVLARFDDPLTQWTGRYLASSPEATLDQTLVSAMERRYSASPRQAFFTGGALHTFSNFDDSYDNRSLTVVEGFRQSVNLVFIRMMRDVVQYHTLRIPGSSARILQDPADVQRLEYLQRFADREGGTFISRFHRRYRGKSSEELLTAFFEGRRLAPQGVAWAYRGVRPDGSVEELERILASLDPDNQPGRDATESVFRRADTSGLALPDIGYLAGVHPLEIWVVRHLLEHPDASLSQVLDASTRDRQEVYRWLLRSSRRPAQDQRIRVMLEVEAFLEVGRSWRRLGYPFEHLVPSLATAIGSSGDRPEALAELVGILLDGGMRRPIERIDRLRFAGGTPYETELARTSVEAVRVLPPEVAHVALSALRDVVDSGTGRRARGVITRADGQPLTIGGKTGTGDNRRYTGGPGQKTASTVVSRTAAFVFHIEDRYFGVVTAYVSGPEAAAFRFTSALPVQVFSRLAPLIEPLVVEAAAEDRPAPNTSDR